MLLRRAIAARILNSSSSIWPIDESSARTPAGWTGWPEGKRFALVLTHDVEGSTGLAKCRDLLRLESRLGFRSAFNFVPEGEYQVPADLRAELAGNGFEIGVHDLKHEGKLFHSWPRFQKNAARINEYIKAWGASGYRSGFMLRNLEWLHELDIQYDASTFDTDPFEAQPDGAGTIFPFWIARSGRGASNGHVTGPSRSAPHSASRRSRHSSVHRDGYVELPYTLPQDSTLFLVLRESSPEIWIRKLDWLAERGGMVLVNVHPDYMQMEGEGRSARTYPADFYSQLLEHIRDRYAGEYWHALPREVAAFTEGRRQEMFSAVGNG